MALATQRAQRSAGQQQREAKILAAARDELTRSGYDGVTMNALAERAGVVKKTLYNLYGSKDDLLLAAIAEVIHGYRGEAAHAQPGIPAILTMRRAGNRTLVANPEYGRAMTHVLIQADPGHPIVKVLLADAITNYVAHLEVASANDELRPGVDVHHLAEQLAAQSWGTIILWMKDLVPLDAFEDRSLSGLLTLLIAATRGPRRRALADMLEPMHLSVIGGHVS